MSNYGKTDLEIHLKKVTEIINKLNANNAYRNQFHLLDQWNIDVIKRLFIDTKISEMVLSEFLEYIRDCLEKIESQISIKINEDVE